MHDLNGDPSQKDGAWLRLYPPFLLALWVFMPEVRRLVDWQVGYNSLPIVNLIPIVALIPLLPVCFAARRVRRATDFSIAVALWACAFGYALLVGCLSGALFGALYEVTLYGLPALAGIWLAAVNRPAALRLFGRIAGWSLWLAVATSLYGLYQYASPPAWDILWVNNANLVSIGKPEPFALRIFGTMNSPGVYADFIAMAILLNLHRLRLATMWLILPLIVCAGALMLTFDRTAWLELGVGFAVYALVSPRRITALASLGVVVVLTIALASNLALITGDASSNNLVADRIGTIADLQQDDSANDRAQQSAVALREALSEPLGQGLGTVGTATKLSAAEDTIVLDNGYLERFLEMGVFGVLCYLGSLVVALVLSINRLSEALTSGDELAGALVATSLAVQIALLGAELSGDHHSALMGIVFWVLVGMTSTLRARAQASERRGFDVSSLHRSAGAS